jgi:hypothetical protein
VCQSVCVKSVCAYVIHCSCAVINTIEPFKCLCAMQQTHDSIHACTLSKLYVVHILVVYHRRGVKVDIVYCAPVVNLAGS